MSYVSLIVRSLVALLLFAAPAFALPSVTISASGGGAYTVQGNNMDGVAGIQFDISYDKTVLEKPSVTQGILVKDAMFIANTTSTHGLIKVAIISTREFSGSGPIATVTFTSKNASPPLPSLTSFSMIDNKGVALTASAGSATAEGAISTPGVPFSQQAQQTSPSTQQQGTSPSSTSYTSTTPAPPTPTYLGTVALPSDQQQQQESQPAATVTAPPVYSGESAPTKIAEQAQPAGVPAVDDKTVETPQYIVYKGILDRFKQYSGSKKLSTIAALFTTKIAQNINQRPAIVVSNGQNKAVLTVDIPGKAISSPNFAVKGGTLVSFKQDKQVTGRWLVEIVPEAGSTTVAVTIIIGNDESEFPLTVVPPLKTALSLDERGWNRFLKEVGTNEAPSHDLNNDGRRDYMDEYIFVAHYLSSQAAKSPKKK